MPSSRPQADSWSIWVEGRALAVDRSFGRAYAVARTLRSALSRTRSAPTTATSHVLGSSSPFEASARPGSAWSARRLRPSGRGRVITCTTRRAVTAQPTVITSAAQSATVMVTPTRALSSTVDACSPVPQAAWPNDRAEDPSWPPFNRSPGFSARYSPTPAPVGVARFFCWQGCGLGSPTAPGRCRVLAPRTRKLQVGRGVCHSSLPSSSRLPGLSSRWSHATAGHSCWDRLIDHVG
jgi:hypothetical protein